MDFDSTPQTLLLERGPRQTREVNIQIYKDNLTELEEVLILELIIVRVDPPDLGVSVSTERNVTIVHIQPSGKDHCGKLELFLQLLVRTGISAYCSVTATCIPRGREKFKFVNFEKKIVC